MPHFPVKYLDKNYFLMPTTKYTKYTKKPKTLQPLGRGGSLRPLRLCGEMGS